MRMSIQSSSQALSALGASRPMRPQRKVQKADQAAAAAASRSVKTFRLRQLKLLWVFQGQAPVEESVQAEQATAESRPVAPQRRSGDSQV